MESLTVTGRRVRRERLGGPAGNELLTAAIGAVLTVLLIAEGITILDIGGLLTIHMFIGLVLIGPVLLKVSSTGYRFGRYYANSRPYREKGPPAPALRLLAPLLVVSTIGVFATGVLLLTLGHMSNELLFLHKAFFFTWGPIFGIHFLAYAPRMLRSLRDGWSATRPRAVPGRGLRGVLIAASLGAGVALAISLASTVDAWQAGGSG
jgi:hypothetical protein